MDLPRPKDRPRRQPETASPEAEAYQKAVDYTRAKLSARCQRLEGSNPEALDLGALAVTALRLTLKGHATAYRGDHSAQMWGDIVRGADRLDGEDIYRLAFEAPEALVEWMRPILAQCGKAPADLEPAPKRGLVAEASEAVSSVAQFAERAARALDDGQLGADDRHDLLKLAHEAFSQLLEATAVLTRDNDTRAAIAARLATRRARTEG